MGCTGDRIAPVRPAAYPRAQTFDRGCRSLWPDMLNAMNRAGFRLMQHDKAAWIASFRWDTAQLPAIHRPEMDLDRLALDEDGAWQKASALQVESAVLVLTPRDPGCEANLRVTYRGEQGGFWRVRNGNPVSSGLFESVILSESNSAIVRKHSRGRRPS
jgi:hypothetical protein